MSGQSPKRRPSAESVLRASIFTQTAGASGRSGRASAGAPAWKGGAYASNGLAGSRSGGLIAATWAAMMAYGAEGYAKYAKQIFATSYAMQEAVTAHAELVEVDGRKLTFEVWAEDEIEKIGGGTHQRIVVDVERFDRRTRSKSTGS